jgi:hypothetical protein
MEKNDVNGLFWNEYESLIGIQSDYRLDPTVDDIYVGFPHVSLYVKGKIAQPCIDEMSEDLNIIIEHTATG